MCAEWEGPGEAAHRFHDLMGRDKDQITKETWLLSRSAQRKQSRTHCRRIHSNTNLKRFPQRSPTHFLGDLSVFSCDQQALTRYPLRTSVVGMTLWVVGITFKMHLPLPKLYHVLSSNLIPSANMQKNLENYFRFYSKDNHACWPSCIIYKTLSVSLQ